MNNTGGILPGLVFYAVEAVQDLFHKGCLRSIKWEPSVLNQQVFCNASDPGWVNALPPRVASALKHLTSRRHVKLPITLVYLDLRISSESEENDVSVEYYVAFSKDSLVLIVPPLNGFTWVYTTKRVLQLGYSRKLVAVSPFTFELQASKEG